jgi:hypothetical protein
MSLIAVVASLIEAAGDQPSINPNTIADAALAKLSPAEIRAGCALALRQIARSQLRRRFRDAPASDGADEAAESLHHESHDPPPTIVQDQTPQPDQPDLFGELQRRYPRQDGTYALLECMRPADFRFNIRRLRAESASKSRHADMLERYARDQAATSRAVARNQSKAL